MCPRLLSTSTCDSHGFACGVAKSSLKLCLDLSVLGCNQIRAAAQGHVSKVIICTSSVLRVGVLQDAAWVYSNCTGPAAQCSCVDSKHTVRVHSWWLLSHSVHHSCVNSARVCAERCFFVVMLVVRFCVACAQCGAASAQSCALCTCLVPQPPPHTLPCWLFTAAPIKHMAGSIASVRHSCRLCC